MHHCFRCKGEDHERQKRKEQGKNQTEKSNRKPQKCSDGLQKIGREEADRSRRLCNDGIVKEVGHLPVRFGGQAAHNILQTSYRNLQ